MFVSPIVRVTSLMMSGRAGLGWCRSNAILY